MVAQKAPHQGVDHPRNGPIAISIMVIPWFLVKRGRGSRYVRHPNNPLLSTHIAKLEETLDPNAII